jgi:hypothetical protein
MRWQVKAAVQSALSRTPWADSANYALQRHLSRSLPASDAMIGLHVEEVAAQVAAYEKRHLAKPQAAFEFGAGWDLVGPMTTWMLGVDRQTIVDIRPHARVGLINHTLARLDVLHEELCDRLAQELRWAVPEPIGCLAELESRFGITYLAPVDARATRLRGASFDLITSTYTLEHIPAADIVSILRECRRLLRPGGMLTAAVDLADHYAFADASITPYNFLRYSDRRWRVANSSLHYQNRLRAPDYLGLVAEAGFDVLEYEEDRPQGEPALPVDLDHRFVRYTEQDLRVTGLRIIASKPG